MLCRLPQASHDTSITPISGSDRCSSREQKRGFIRSAGACFNVRAYVCVAYRNNSCIWPSDYPYKQVLNF